MSTDISSEFSEASSKNISNLKEFSLDRRKSLTTSIFDNDILFDFDPPKNWDDRIDLNGESHIPLHDRFIFGSKDGRFIQFKTKTMTDEPSFDLFIMAHEIGGVGRLLGFGEADRIEFFHGKTVFDGVEDLLGHVIDSS